MGFQLLGLLPCIEFTVSGIGLRVEGSRVGVLGFRVFRVGFNRGLWSFSGSSGFNGFAPKGLAGVPSPLGFRV